MSASVVLVLVGIPGAGKTTFSKKCETFFNDCNVTIFHYDKLCKNFTSDERKSVFAQVESFIVNVTKDSMQSDKPNIIIIDDNNYYKSMCYEYMKLCRKYNLSYLVVYLKISIAKAFEQNLARKQCEQVPEEIIQDMFVKLELPKGDYVLHINVEESRDFNLDFVRENVEIAWKHPLNEIEPREVVRMSVTRLQKVDLVLRKIVHDKIKDNVSKAKIYNQIKKDLFKQIRLNQIRILFFDNHEFTSETDSLQLEEELLSYFVQS